jgi:hypothetical protein
MTAGWGVIERGQRALRHVEGRDLHAKLRQRRADELPQCRLVIDDERKLRFDGNAISL